MCQLYINTDIKETSDRERTRQEAINILKVITTFPNRCLFKSIMNPQEMIITSPIPHSPEQKV